MSEKAEKKKEEPAADAGDKKKKGGIGALLTKLPVLLSGVMLIEAVVLFAGMKMLMPSPQAAVAEVDLNAHGEESAASEESASEPAEGGHGEAAPATGGKKVDPKKSTEVQVVSFKAPNSLSGRTFMYDVEIVATVKGANQSKVKSAIEERGALIKDRIRTIIAQSDPKKLGGGSEPGLETLRRQVKYQLDEIIGEGYVDEVLVPRCIPFRTDF
jgi:flagellar basal body-associated protein FliL